MRLSSVFFENYRAFVDEARLELRPLTLLFGYNSAGKSSVLRLFPILGESTKSEQAVPLALDSPAARNASFHDILSRASSSPTLKIGLEFVVGQENKMEIVYFLRDLADRQTQVVEKFKLKAPLVFDQPLEALWDAEWTDLMALASTYEFRIGDQKIGSFEIPFDGLVFDVPSNIMFADALATMQESVRSLGKRIHWLNSLRVAPPRSTRFGVRPREMAPDGSNAGAYLAHDILAGGELLEKTALWFQLVTGRHLAIRSFAAGGESQYSVILASPMGSSDFEVPIVDTGEGMAQVLPVLVLGCLASLGRLGSEAIIAIEHPELHLHPAAHAALGAFFCSVAKSQPKPTLIIETHSENLLLRLQIAIARKELAKEDIVIHWVRELADGRSAIDTITFDENARPQGAGWPPGVFREDAEQARTLIELRREHASK